MTNREFFNDSSFRPLPKETDVLIVGAGPTGLGAAIRLEELGYEDWCLVDESARAGGLSQTERTDEGFLFDLGGHVIFSHYEYFDDLINHAVGGSTDAWTVHQRVSYVWLKDRWVPYPFQNNLFCLDENDKLDCFKGLLDAELARGKHPKPINFDEWIVQTMGVGIADLFMRPYNFKVWAYPPASMQCEWLGERVATVDIKKVTENIIRDKADEGWGPNAVFRFPKNGGTGGIWTSVYHLLSPDRAFLGKRLTEIDFDKKIARFESGEACQYKRIITTAPLDTTLIWAGRDDLASNLFYSSTHIVGLGFRGVNPHDKKCWLYFPEDQCPFYRCTVFSHYAEANCPSANILLPTIQLGDGTLCEAAQLGKGPYWSLMFEISESPQKQVGSRDFVIQDTIRGAVNTGLISNNTEIVSVFYKRLERGYPTPSLSRDKIITEALQILKDKDVWSRGRFGAWKYEVGNQDHSLMQGVEAVNNILFGTPELTLEYPNVVNGKRNSDIRYKTK
jgi:protoporphyrinogen oxidase